VVFSARFNTQRLHQHLFADFDPVDQLSFAKIPVARKINSLQQ